MPLSGKIIVEIGHRSTQTGRAKLGVGDRVKRLNFTLDEEAGILLDQISEKYYHGNKSLTVRAALESLATHLGHAGWVIAGYAPMVLDHEENCHSCGTEYAGGEVLYRPVFQRGNAPDAMQQIPQESWLDCSKCVEMRTAVSA